MVTINLAVDFWKSIGFTVKIICYWNPRRCKVWIFCRKKLFV